MNCRLLRTEQANRQMIEIAMYIAEESGDYGVALGVVTKLENAMRLLGEALHRGALPITEALHEQGHRVIVVGSYLIFYRADDEMKTVTITAVVHAKQDYLRAVR